jgi:diguanylate cyclase
MSFLARTGALRRPFSSSRAALCAGVAGLLAVTPNGTVTPIPLVAALTLGLAALRTAFQSVLDRNVWRTIAITTGFGIAGVLLQAFGLPLTNPAVTGLYIITYPLTALAIVLMIRNRTTISQSSIWIDAGIASSAGMTVLIALLGRVVASRNSGWEQFVAVVFPVLSLLVFAAMTLLGSTTGWRLAEQPRLMVTAFSLVVVSDLAPIVEQLNGVQLNISTRALAAAHTLSIFAVRASDRWAVKTREGKSHFGVLAVAWVGVALSFSALWVQPTSMPVRITAIATMVFVLMRLTTGFAELREAMNHHLEARTDDLTGLPNRRALREQLDEVLKAKTPAAVLMLDLDRFKEINDTLGHDVGDQLLQAMAARLRRAISSVRIEAKLYRLGGDEFACLVSDPAEATRLVDEFHRMVEVPIVLESERVDQRVSIGVALYPDHGTGASDLLRHADAAMYLAKHSGSRSVVYSSAREDMLSPLRLQGLVHEMIDGRQFELHYQPKVSLLTNRINGVEALLRVSSDGHPVPPPVLIATATRMGLITELTDAVLDRAARDAAMIAASGLSFPVSFNVTPQDLSSGTLAGRVLAATKRHRVKPSALTVEVTEESVVADPVAASTTAAQLRAEGFAVSMDDFGVGYSSLSNLRSLVVDELKIDQSFTAEMVNDQRTAALVESMVQLANRLDAEVVIEGVETEEQRRAAAAFGIGSAQGWLFARAMPLQDLFVWIEGQAIVGAHEGRRDSYA